MQKNQLEFSVRADLFRVAQAFTDSREAAHAGVRIEPLAQGGVVMVGMSGVDMIAVVDRSGEANRPGTIGVSKAMTSLAVDLFRLNGEEVRLVGSDDMVVIKHPHARGQAQRDIELPARFPDWRQILAPHTATRMELPVAFDARMAKRIGDAAIGLARAARSDDESFSFKGGQNAYLITFTAWPEAVALFHDTRRAALEEDRSTLWLLPDWLTRPLAAQLQAVS